MRNQVFGPVCTSMWFIWSEAQSSPWAGAPPTATWYVAVAFAGTFALNETSAQRIGLVVSLGRRPSASAP